MVDSVKQRCDVLSLLLSGGSGDDNDEQVPQGSTDARRRRATRRDRGAQHQYPHHASRTQRTVHVGHTRDNEDHPLVVDVSLTSTSRSVDVLSAAPRIFVIKRAEWFGTAVADKSSK